MFYLHRSLIKVFKKITLFEIDDNFNLAVTDLIFIQVKMLYKIVEKLGAHGDLLLKY